MSTDKELLYTQIEPLVDDFHKSLPIFKRDRGVALLHLLRCFEDQTRVRTTQALFNYGAVEFFIALQHAQDGLVWATRWIWDLCPRKDSTTLQVDWDVYDEAAKLFLHSADYYHLYRCFVLCRRGHFDVVVDSSQKKVQFKFRSDEEKELDAARQLRETRQDAEIVPSTALRSHLDEWVPLVRELFPCWIEKIDDHSIRYTIPAQISWVFTRWAGLQVQQMPFDLPSTWQFGSYNLDQFRLFWKSLLAAALTHSFAHRHNDKVAGATNLMTGSVVMHLSEEEMESVCNRFPLPLEVRRSIIRDFTYAPIPGTAYWDPIWQPLFRLNDNSFFVAPDLILGSSAERNLVTLLNKRPQTRQQYHQVSLQKEGEQLSALEKLFPDVRFLKRRRVTIKRTDGTTLSDIDLLVLDRVENFAIIIQTKWLVRPDYVTEVMSRDEEILRALGIMVAVVARARELGAGWLAQVLGESVANTQIELVGLIINRDFLPSGWVKEDSIPVIDMAFIHDFISSTKFTGLRSLYGEAHQLDKILVAKHSAKDDSILVRVGDYSFEWPAMEPFD